MSGYRGRVAPSPTGFLHLGHARTFWTAFERTRAVGGSLVYRDDDLDGPRCRPEFSEAAQEDLCWLGIRWDEGPFRQSARMAHYTEAFERLRVGGFIYPCKCSRRDITLALSAPHASDEEAVYPGTCRPRAKSSNDGNPQASPETSNDRNWRFRVTDGEAIEFTDVALGSQRAVAGVDFGDFVVWRKDGFPSYHLACVVDDALMGITEVVRGEDLITSTFRQLLLFRALGWTPPAYFHCPLVLDEQGQRLAKRHDALSLRELREQGMAPKSLQQRWSSAAS
jgi:glutamyl/glutaminyl-tRNA synthetase